MFSENSITKVSKMLKNAATRRFAGYWRKDSTPHKMKISVTLLLTNLAFHGTVFANTHTIETIGSFVISSLFILSVLNIQWHN
jgi:hypothetical protein